MAVHNDLGKDAENMAVDYLIENGYEILYRNWRYSRYELDIIAMKNELLRIIEVKALRRSTVRFPEESVTRKKFRYLQRAADEFIFQNPQYRNLQFEILSVIMDGDRGAEFFIIADVFL